MPVASIYIYIYSRHCTYDYSSRSDFNIDLPVNITLPANTAFYITDITIPVSWYMIEAGRNNCLYYRMRGLNAEIAKVIIPE